MFSEISNSLLPFSINHLRLPKYLFRLTLIYCSPLHKHWENVPVRVSWRKCVIRWDFAVCQRAVSLSVFVFTLHTHRLSMCQQTIMAMPFWNSVTGDHKRYCVRFYVSASHAGRQRTHIFVSLFFRLITYITQSIDSRSLPKLKRNSFKFSH